MDDRGGESDEVIGPDAPFSLPIQFENSSKQ